MDIGFLLKGVAIGFSIAAPVGPIGVLCIRRTLAEGWLPGLICGLGAATADAVYSAVAGLGLTSLAALLVGQQLVFRLVGGVFLLYLGIRILLSRPPETLASERPRNLPGAFASTFVLTLANPVTILSFAAIFAGLGVADESRSYLSAGATVLGVFAGSALWWLILSTVVGLSRTRFTPSGLRWPNRIGGLVIIGFGIAALASLAW